MMVEVEAEAVFELGHKFFLSFFTLHRNIEDNVRFKCERGSLPFLSLFLSLSS